MNRILQFAMFLSSVALVATLANQVWHDPGAQAWLLDALARGRAATGEAVAWGYERVGVSTGAVVAPAGAAASSVPAPTAGTQPTASMAAAAGPEAPLVSGRRVRIPWPEFFATNPWPDGKYIAATEPLEDGHFGLWFPFHGPAISPDKGWGIEFIGDGFHF